MRLFQVNPLLSSLGGWVCAEVVGDGESAHDSPREETLQNISADDLPDSASQAAHPQDSAFSYRYFFDRILNLRLWAFHHRCSHFRLDDSLGHR